MAQKGIFRKGKRVKTLRKELWGKCGPFLTRNNSRQGLLKPGINKIRVKERSNRLLSVVPKLEEGPFPKNTPPKGTIGNTYLVN